VTGVMSWRGMEQDVVGVRWGMVPLSIMSAFHVKSQDVSTVFMISPSVSHAILVAHSVLTAFSVSLVHQDPLVMEASPVHSVLSPTVLIATTRIQSA
jgi:hypothetical protein